MRTKVISVRLGIEQAQYLDELALRNGLNRNQMVNALIDGAIQSARLSDDRGSIIGLRPLSREQTP